MKVARKNKNKLNIIGFKEFRQSAEKYISQIEKGSSFTVLRRSKPIFKLTPVDSEPAGSDSEMWETVVDLTKINPNGVSARDIIKSLRKARG